MEILLALHSSNEIMMAQKALLKAGVRIRIVAMPREISHDCGVAILFHERHLARVYEIIDEKLYGEARYFRRIQGTYDSVLLPGS